MGLEAAMAFKALVVWAMVAGLPFGVARAAEEKRREEAGLREARGAVNQVDKDKNRVTLDEPKGAPLTLQIDKSTTIFIDGRSGTLDEIRAGAEVRASYETKAGANKAQWIEVSKKAKKPGTSKERLPEAPTAPAPGQPTSPPVSPQSGPSGG